MHRVNKDRISITVPGVLRFLAAVLRESKRHRWLNAGNPMFHHYHENDTLRRNTFVRSRLQVLWFLTFGVVEMFRMDWHSWFLDVQFFREATLATDDYRGSQRIDQLISKKIIYLTKDSIPNVKCSIYPKLVFYEICILYKNNFII